MASYALTTSYAGESLLSGFNWFDQVDPSRGYVSYQSRPNAEALGLYSVDPKTGVVRLGVDSTNTYSLTAGRPSIRLESKEAFNHGLFIADFLHMPPSRCGLWPAFWSYGPNWPAGGEVDIIEGANDQYGNLLSAHTVAGCTMSKKSLTGKFLGDQRETDCHVGDNNVGCGYASGDSSAYGDGFNAVNGGVYAMEWDDEFIKIWHFERRDIPTDITNKTPDPTEWGLPDAIFGGDGCEVDDYFRDMSLVININFCGDWGNAIWGKSDGCGSYAATCSEYVANNPQAFADAYWDVRYIEAYQKIDVRHASPSPPPSTTEPVTWVTMTTTLTTTVTVRRQHRVTSTIVHGQDTTSVLVSDAASSYTSAPEAVTADTTSAYKVDTASSSKSAPQEAAAITTSIYAVNAMSSSKFTSEESTANMTPVYKLNTTSYKSAPEESAAITTSIYAVNATLSSKFTSEESTANMTPVYKLNKTSSYKSTPEETTGGTTSIYNLNATSLYKSATKQATADTTSVYKLNSTLSLGSSYSSHAVSSPISVLSIPSEVPVPKNPMQLGNFTYRGCYGSDDDFETFHKAKDSKDMTIDLCVHLCRGSMFSGVHDTQCFCADSLDANTRAADTKKGYICDHPCPGNDAQYCGGRAKSPLGKLANATSTAASDRSGDLTTARDGKNSTLASHLHVPAKRSLVSRMERDILLTVYGAVKDETPPSPPMAENNITYTSTGYSTTVRVKTITVVPLPVQKTAGVFLENMMADKSPSESDLADKTVVSTQETSVMYEDKPDVDQDPAKAAAPTGENSDPARNGFVADNGPGGSRAGDKTVDRALETAAPSNVHFVMDKRPGASPVGGKAVTKTVDQVVVVEDCGCTDGETHGTASPFPPSSPEQIDPYQSMGSNMEIPVPAEGPEPNQPVLPPAQDTNSHQSAGPNIEVPVAAGDPKPKPNQPVLPPAQDSNSHQPVPLNIEIPVAAGDPKHTQPVLPPAQDTNSHQSVGLNTEVPVAAGDPKHTQPKLPPAQDTYPHQSAGSNIEAPVPAEGPKHIQTAPKPAQNTQPDDTETSGNDYPAPVGPAGDTHHAPSSPAPLSPPPPLPPAQIVYPQRGKSLGFETLPTVQTSQDAKIPSPSVVIAGAGKTWSRTPGMMLGLIMLVVVVLL